MQWTTAFFFWVTRLIFDRHSYESSCFFLFDMNRRGRVSRAGTCSLYYSLLLLVKDSHDPPFFFFLVWHKTKKEKWMKRQLDTQGIWKGGLSIHSFNLNDLSVGIKEKEKKKKKRKEKVADCWKSMAADIAGMAECKAWARSSLDHTGDSWDTMHAFQMKDPCPARSVGLYLCTFVPLYLCTFFSFFFFQSIAPSSPSLCPNSALDKSSFFPLPTLNRGPDELPGQEAEAWENGHGVWWSLLRATFVEGASHFTIPLSFFQKWI